MHTNQFATYLTLGQYYSSSEAKNKTWNLQVNPPIFLGLWTLIAENEFPHPLQGHTPGENPRLVSIEPALQATRHHRETALDSATTIDHTVREFKTGERPASSKAAASPPAAAAGAS